MYKIEIYYQTGDSFGCQDTQDSLGVSLNTLEEAKLCLLYLKEHYQFIKNLKQINCYSSRNVKEKTLKKSVKSKSWYDTEGYPEGCFMFKDQRVSAFYLGYFETLYKAAIEIENSDMTFTPGD